MENKKFYCAACKYGCDNNSTYKKHISSQVHARGGQKKIYKCDACDYTTSISLWNCKMHFISKHATKEVRAQQKYYCDVCDVVFFSPLYLNAHNKILSHLTKVAKKRISEQPEQMPQKLIDEKIVEITNEQLKINSDKFEIYAMADELANKIKNKTKKEFKVESMKKIINNMMSLLNE